MAYKPQPGLVSGESMKDAPKAPQTPEDVAKAEEKAIDTMDTIGRVKDSHSITISDGRQITCRVAKVGQMGLVLKFLRDVAEKMEVLSTNPDYLSARMAEIGDSPLLFITLLERAELHLWPVVVSLTSLKDEEEAKELDIDDAFGVAKVLFELNKDFFLQRVLPIVQGEISAK